jgi:4'-phosphopantetheinyl transferase
MGDWALAENQVDIWQIQISGQGGVERRRQLLSPDEVQRADAFQFEKHRRRYIAGRAAMRQILGIYTEIAPKELVFSYGEKGKPELAGELKRPEIKFNLSNSQDVAVLAVTQNLTVGIDIEWINPEFATDEIARRFFAEGEVRRLQALPVTERSDAFFACWTRKEAYIKALGEGLSVPLDSFEVAFGPGVPAALLQVRVNPSEIERWSMYDIAVTQGFRSALIVEGKGHRLRHMQWEEAEPEFRNQDGVILYGKEASNSRL